MVDSATRLCHEGCISLTHLAHISTHTLSRFARSEQDLATR